MTLSFSEMKLARRQVARRLRSQLRYSFCLAVPVSAHEENKSDPLDMGTVLILAGSVAARGDDHSGKGSRPECTLDLEHLAGTEAPGQRLRGRPREIRDRHSERQPSEDCT